MQRLALGRARGDFGKLPLLIADPGLILPWRAVKCAREEGREIEEEGLVRVGLSRSSWAAFQGGNHGMEQMEGFARQTVGRAMAVGG